MRIFALLMIFSLPFAMGCGSTIGAPRPDRATQVELDRLQGVWKLVRLDAEELDSVQVRVVFQGSKGFVVFAAAGATVMQRFRFEMDSSKSPGEFTLFPYQEDKPQRRWYSTAKGASDGPESRVLGIFKYDGSRLVLAVDSANARDPRDDTRPTAFEPKRQQGRVAVITLEKTSEPVPEFKKYRETPVTTKR